MPVKKDRKSDFQIQRRRFGYAMVAPGTIFLALVTTIPLLSLFLMSTFRIDLTFPSGTAWVGPGNYLEITRDNRFWHAVWVTVIYTGSSVLLQVVIGLALALAFFRGFRGEALMRISVLLPMILAPVVVGLAWRTLILTPEYGILDYLAILAGLGSRPWLVNPAWALFSVIMIHTWQWTPFAFLVFLASLNSLPPEPLEAAMLDAPKAWQRFRYVTLPLIWPSVIIVVIIRTMVALRAFAAIFSATGGGPGTATEILNLYAYRVSFNSLDLGYGAALGTLLLCITAIVSLVFFRLKRSDAG
ncbi:MAG: sugar ABC transporter permease [Thermodesulfobacteriota bacterium]